MLAVFEVVLIGFRVHRQYTIIFYRVKKGRIELQIYI